MNGKACSREETFKTGSKAVDVEKAAHGKALQEKEQRVLKM